MGVYEFKLHMVSQQARNTGERWPSLESKFYRSGQASWKRQGFIFFFPPLSYFLNHLNLYWRISSVQLFSCVQLFATPWTAARQASLSITNSQSLLRLMFIKSGDVIQPSCPLSSPFSCLQSFPASESFPMSQFFASGGHSIGVSASASVLPINI